MRRLLALPMLALVLAACGGGEVVSPTAERVVGSVPTQTLPKGDAMKGRELYDKNGCGGCHTFKPASSTGKVGPDLDNLAADAQKANQGSVEAYTAQSITNPDAYVAPGFSAGVMPSFSQLSQSEVADLVAFLTQGS